MKRWLPRLLVVLCLALMVAAVAAQWREIRALEWRIDGAGLAVSLAALVVIFFLDAWGWHLTLRALGARIGALASIRVWMVSSLARYLPGGVWSYASRVYLAREAGVDGARAGLSLYLESLLLMAGSLAVGLPSLGAASGLPFGPAGAILLLLLVSLLMHPRAVGLLRRIPGRVGRALAGVELPTTARSFGLYAYYVAFWAAFSGVFFLFVRAILPVPPEAWLPVATSLAMGFLIGFVLLFVPGGLGVREGAMYLLLLPFLSPAESLVISIGSRLWLMAGEALSLALVWLLFRPRPPARTAV